MEEMLTSNRTTKEVDRSIDNHKMEQLIQVYGDGLLRLCTLYLKDRHLAEDALQDTYVKVWKNFSSYRGEAQEKTWITRIAINVCKNYLRSPWIRKVNALDMNELLGKSSEEFQHKESNIDLMNAILKLKGSYRITILLYYYQELSVKEISEMLNKKESTVLSLLKRGREQLKNHMIGLD